MEEEALILSDIFRIIAADPHPEESVTLGHLTSTLNGLGHKVTKVHVLGYLIQQQDAGVLSIKAVGERGEPHIHMLHKSSLAVPRQTINHA